MSKTDFQYQSDLPLWNYTINCTDQNSVTKVDESVLNLKSLNAMGNGNLVFFSKFHVNSNRGHVKLLTTTTNIRMEK